MPRNRTAVITGSTSGIGLAIAKAFAAEDWRVVVNSFSDAPEDHAIVGSLAKQHAGEVTYVPADMSKADDCRTLVAMAAKKFGSVDVLVNNAGIQHVAPVEEFPPQMWDAVSR